MLIDRSSSALSPRAEQGEESPKKLISQVRKLKSRYVCLPPSFWNSSTLLLQVIVDL